MGTNYIRQSSASIVTNNTIEAAHFNDEFDQLESAFNGSTGHSHDGTTGEGQLIGMTTAVTGILPIANGGTAGSTAAGARTALGLVIGTDVQTEDAGLTSIAALTTLADRMPYTTASDVYAVTPLTAFARTILDDANAAAVRATLGVGTGSGDALTTDPLSQFAATTSAQLAGVISDETGTGSLVLASSPTLVTPALGTPSALVLTNATGLVLTNSHTGVLPPANMGTGTSITTKYLRGDGTWQTIATGGIGNIVEDTTPQLGGNLDLNTFVITGLDIGTDVQAYDASLTSLAALATAANKMVYVTGVDTYAETDLTSFGRSLIDDASSAAARTTMGLVIGTDVQAYDATIVVDADIGSTVQAYATVLANTTASYTSAEETKLAGITATADVTGSNTCDTPNIVQTTVTGNSGSSTYASNVTVAARNTTAATHYISFHTGQTGNTPVYTDSGLTYNPSTGLMSMIDLTVTSDINHKNDVQDIHVAWGDFSSLRPRTHRWNEGKGPEGVHSGLIAQEVEEVYPEYVITNDEGIKSLNYQKMIPMLIDRIQEMHSRIRKLEK